MLTDKQKTILGILTDMNILHGDMRIEAGQNNDVALSIINEVTPQVLTSLNHQLEVYKNQRETLNYEIEHLEKQLAVFEGE